MSFYAVDDDDLIDAWDAEKGTIYWCLDCFGPVKKRQGRYFPHFYHLQTASQCRLYSKSEDHLRAQIEIQKQFGPKVLQMERPFPAIGRVADLCWEQEKVVFEIQCSLIHEKEVERRIHDYRFLGYEIVWLLDDKRFNKRILRPSEAYLRVRSCYYLSIKRGRRTEVYDQFEIFSCGERVKKGKPMPIDLQDKVELPPERREIFQSSNERQVPLNKSAERLLQRRPLSDQLLFPTQIRQLIAHCPHYFLGSRLELASKSNNPAIACKLENWRILEQQWVQKEKKRPSRFRLWFSRYLAEPYVTLLNSLLRSFCD